MLCLSLNNNCSRVAGCNALLCMYFILHTSLALTLLTGVEQRQDKTKNNNRIIFCVQGSWIPRKRFNVANRPSYILLRAPPLDPSNYSPAHCKEYAKPTASMRMHFNYACRQAQKHRSHLLVDPLPSGSPCRLTNDTAPFIFQSNFRIHHHSVPLLHGRSALSIPLLLGCSAHCLMA
jgi:hypothetical protein